MKSLIINQIGLNEFSFYLPCLYSRLNAFCADFLIGTYKLCFPKTSFVKTSTVTTCNKYVALLYSNTSFVAEFTLYVPSSTTQATVTNMLKTLTVNGQLIKTVTVTSFTAITFV